MLVLLPLLHLVSRLRYALQLGPPDPPPGSRGRDRGRVRDRR